MVWGETLPSGRERAIETLIDMEPQGSFYRAARVLVSLRGSSRIFYVDKEAVSAAMPFLKTLSPPCLCVIFYWLVD